jgi:carboxypeptidase C (cathepsin A)
VFYTPILIKEVRQKHQINDLKNSLMTLKLILNFKLLFLCSLITIAQTRTIPTDTVVITHHKGIFNGVSMNYIAETGTQPVWNENGKPVASLHYTYYRKSGEIVPNRPLLISFNGGPGSASVWMHLAYTGPKTLKIDDEGFPIQPYGVKDNPFSVLDVTDIVYVNPANTGYSRTIPVSGEEVKKEYFFGVNADIKYLADWLSTFVSRHDRWRSPKFIIGESYGGTRVSGLAGELQSRQWMYLNGVILVSPADYKSYRTDGPISYGLTLPYFAAAAWYHKRLPPDLQQKDLTEILPEIEQFTINTLLPALADGGFINSEKKDEIATKMARYSGLSKKVIIQYNLRIPTSFFWKELLRDTSGHTIGRLDSRYLGLDEAEGGDTPDFNAEITSWLHSFTPAINHYFKHDLKFDTDLKYNMFGPVHPWDFSDNETREALRMAMASNPYLQVLYQTGYYDGATTYFNSKYSMWQLDPSGKMKDRMHFKGYRSGHMMYLRRDDLKSSNDDLRIFINNTTPRGVSAKY